MQIINVAKQFSKYPAGRFKNDGPFSGEKFREEWLVPVLESTAQVTIEFDGTRGYGSSFLEEAFGGLVRLGYSPEKIKSSFIFVSSDPSLSEEISEYIDHGADPM